MDSDKLTGYLKTSFKLKLTHLNQFQIFIHEKMPWKCLAESSWIHFEIGQVGRQRLDRFIFILFSNIIGMREQVTIAFRVALNWFDDNAYVDIVQNASECFQ